MGCMHVHVTRIFSTFKRKLTTAPVYLPTLIALLCRKAGTVLLLAVDDV